MTKNNLAVKSENKLLFEFIPDATKIIITPSGNKKCAIREPAMR